MYREMQIHTHVYIYIYVLYTYIRRNERIERYVYGSSTRSGYKACGSGLRIQVGTSSFPQPLAVKPEA